MHMMLIVGHFGRPLSSRHRRDATVMFSLSIVLCAFLAISFRAFQRLPDVPRR